MSFFANRAIDPMFGFYRNNRKKEQRKPGGLATQHPVGNIVAMVTMGKLTQFFFLEGFMSVTEYNEYHIAG